MATFKIPSHLSICELASSMNLAPWEKEFEIPLKSTSSKKESLRIASEMVARGDRTAIEVNVNGVLRSQRAPIARYSPQGVEIFKVSTSMERLDRAIYVVGDLLTTAEKNPHCSLTAKGHVVYLGSEQVSVTARELAEKLRIALIGEAHIYGLFD